MNGQLEGRRVFLSASFPGGERGEVFEPYDAAEIADAVTAVVRAVFTAGGGLVIGGHPTITPLVLFVASEHDWRGAVDIFQSAWYESEIPPETLRLQELGFGTIRWAERGSSEAASLRLMRELMLRQTDPVAGVFVGGMAGIEQEWDLFGQILPDRPRIPIGAPGGAAASLVGRDSRLPAAVESMLSTARYPVLAHRIVKYLIDQQAST